MVTVSHCCPITSRACCSLALRRLIPLNWKEQWNVRDKKKNSKPKLDMWLKCDGCRTSRSWSPYSKRAWCAMLPAVTLETNTPPFSPLTIEIPSGSAPFCTVTLRGSSKYGLQGVGKETFCVMVCKKLEDCWQGATCNSD